MAVSSSPPTSAGDASSPSGGPRRRRWAIAAIVLTVLAAGVLAAALLIPTGNAPPPSVAASSDPSAAAPANGSTLEGASTGESSLQGAGEVAGLDAYAAQGLPRSVPTELDIPAIGVHSTLLQLGLNPDRTVQVPPLERDSKAGWLTTSPTPGQLGPAVLLGHVDSAQFGPGIFSRLKTLRPGQPVSVTRADATVAEFVVDRVESYPKSAFPSAQVYGNTPNPQLRLITCGGVFDHAARSYENNIVVYAHLVPH